MSPTTPLDQLDAEQLRSLVTQLLQHVERLDKEVLHQKTSNQQLIHEIALLKRHRFAKRAESFSPVSRPEYRNDERDSGAVSIVSVSRSR